MVWVNSGNLTFWSMPYCLNLMELRSRQMKKGRDRWEGKEGGTEEANERSYHKQKIFLKYIKTNGWSLNRKILWFWYLQSRSRGNQSSECLIRYR